MLDFFPDDKKTIFVHNIKNMMMIVVSDESIDAAFEIFNQTSEEELQQLFERFSNEQPLILGYIFAMSAELDVENYKDVLLQISLIIWQSFLLEAKSIPEITSDIIYGIEAKKMDRLDGLLETEDENSISQENILALAPQPNLLEFISGQIDDVEEEEEIDDATQLMLFTILEVIIECFDEVINRRNLKIILN